MGEFAMLNSKEIRKYIALILFFAFLLTGCGTQGEDKPSGGHENAAATEAASHGETNSHGEPAKTEPPQAAHGEGSAMPSAITATTHSPTPAPTPTPSPTETPKGDIIHGWVSGIPAYVPRFVYGEIDISQSKITEGSISTVFHLFIKGVEMADMDEYAIELKNAGYIVAVAELGNTYTLTASKDFGWNFVSLVITLAEGDGIAVYTLDVPE